MELVAFELIHIFLLVIKRSAIINWATIISLSSDMLLGVGSYNQFID